jgi:hypothetical protein
LEVLRVKNQNLAYVLVASSVGLIVSMGACSSSSNSATTTGDAGSDSATSGDSGGSDSGVINDPDNCVPPGTAGNELGIGGYCSPLGGQCDTAGPGGAARICTADLTSTPAHAWFCTYPCTGPSDCGSGEVCFENNEGAGCIPNSCLSLDVDAGHILTGDGGTDGGDGG